MTFKPRLFFRVCVYIVKIQPARKESFAHRVPGDRRITPTSVYTAESPSMMVSYFFMNDFSIFPMIPVALQMESTGSSTYRGVGWIAADE